MKESVKVAVLVIALTLVGVGAARISSNTNPVLAEGEVTISGGHRTDPRDHGRPVVLVAAGLGVPAQVFRDAFSHVRPAPAGQEPDPEQVRKNKDALLEALGKYGVTNERLDQVSNYYRYNGRKESLWKHRDAKLRAKIADDKVVKIDVVDAGSGYTSVPTVSVEGHPEAKLSVKLVFSKDLEKNGGIESITLVRASS